MLNPFGLFGKSTHQETLGSRLPTFSEAFDPLRDFNNSAITDRKKLQSLVRNNAIASAVVDKWVKSASGGSWTIRTKNSELKNSWETWASNCEVSSAMALDEYVHSLAYSYYVDGEVFVEMQVVNGQLKLRTIPATRIPETLDENNPAVSVVVKNVKKRGVSAIRKGIGFDVNGQRVTYYYHSARASEMSALTADNIKRISQQRVLHYFQPKGDIRGTSKLIAVTPYIQLYDEYVKQMLTAKQRTSSLTPIVQFQSAGAQKFASMHGTSVQDIYNKFQELSTKTESGKKQAISLPEFVKVELPDMQKIKVDDAEFLTNIQRTIASAAGVSHAELFATWQGMSYSSARMDNKLLQQQYAIERGRIKNRVIVPIFHKWLEIESAKGNNLDIADVDFVPDRFIEVDPQKQTKSDTDELKNKTTSPQVLCAANGRDYDQVMEDWIAHAKKMRKMNGNTTGS